LTVEQENLRQPILSFLQGHTNELDDDAVVIGFALIVEALGKNGERCIIKLTSDAGGLPLPYYTVEGLAIALNQECEVDEILVEDDD
jgi:hypothetical protein